MRLWVPPCVFIYENVIELWVMETKNSQNVFSVSITHNSKIKELSDGNIKLETELWLAKQTFFLELRWVPPFLRIELWKLRIEWWELPIQTAPKSPVFVWAFMQRCSFLCNLSIFCYNRRPFLLKIIHHYLAANIFIPTHHTPTYT